MNATPVLGGRTPLSGSGSRGLREGVGYALWAGLALLVALIAGIVVTKHHTYGVGLAAGVLLIGVAAFRLDAAYVALIVVAMVAPVFIGVSPWIPLLGLVTVLAFIYAFQSGSRLSAAAAPLGLYCLVYVVSAIFAGPGSASLLALAKYVGPPLFAIATLLIAQDRRRRKLFLTIIIVGCLIQVPLVVAQTAPAFANPLLADNVTGFSTDSNTLAEIEVIGGLLLLGMAVAGVRHGRLLTLASVILFSVPVLDGAKSGAFTIPVGIVALAIAVLISARDRVMRRRAILLLSLAAVALPTFVIAENALYPGTAADLSSPTDVLNYLNTKNVVGEPVPDRGVALSTAVHITSTLSPLRALVGLGPGTAQTNLSFRLPDLAGTPDLLITPEQETNRVWVARTLVETGILGLIAFVGLFAYLFAVGCRGMKFLPRGDIELGLLVALPGIVAATFVMAFGDTVLSLAPDATVFWLIAALGIAAGSDAWSGKGVTRRPLTRAGRDTVSHIPVSP